MQIMNLEKLAKELWWSLTAFRTINELPDSVIFVNYDGIIERVNSKAKECFGIIIDELNPPKLNDYIKDGMDIINLSIRNQKPVAAVATIPGREFHIELNAVKRGPGYCLSVRDLTKLTDEIVTEEKIARFNGEKNAMLVKLEGDIKSPISSITGFSQGLLDGIGGNLTEKQAKYIKIINSNSNDLYHFMDKLLEFTESESSLYKSMYQNFDVVQIIKGIASEFEKEIQNKKISFEIEADGLEKRTVYSDLKAVEKIVRNILETSVSMTETGFILVNISRPDEVTASTFGLSAENISKSHVQITLKDTGVGFAEDEMKFLCDPYAQLEKGKKNFVRSLNLGSASILTKRANGFINIQSEANKGTRYDIIFPAEKD